MVERGYYKTVNKEVNKVTYIDRLNAFNRWLESNALPGNAQLMYFRLLNVFNRAGWPESVQIDSLRLMRISGCQKDAAYRARDKLAKSGFISYKKGSKGRPTTYILSEKTTEYATVTAAKSTAANAPANAPASATHIKNKNKNNTRNDLSVPKTYDMNELEALAALRLPERL